MSWQSWLRTQLGAGAASGLAQLGSDSKVPTAQIPALALVKPTVVVDLAGRLALTAEVGDVAVQSDTSKTYMLGTDGASVEGNWVELLFPAGISNVTTTLGDMLYCSVTGTPGTVARLGADTSNTRKFLRTQSIAGVGQAPAWDTLLAADVPDLSSTYLTVATAAATYATAGHTHATYALLAGATFTGVVNINPTAAASPAALSIIGQAGSGANVGGGNTTIAAGASTGTGAPGHLYLQASYDSPTPSSTLNDLYTIADISVTGVKIDGSASWGRMTKPLEVYQYGANPSIILGASDYWFKLTRNTSTGELDFTSAQGYGYTFDAPLGRIPASGANAAGLATTIRGGQSTGSAAGGSILFQVSPAGTAGSSVNALATALTIASDKSATFEGILYVTDIYGFGSGNLLIHGASNMGRIGIDGTYALNLTWNTAYSMILGTNGIYLGNGSPATVLATPIMQITSAGAYLGNGVTAAVPSGKLIAATGGSGANVAGAALTLAGGQSTGSAAGGSILFQVSPAGGAGSSANALATALTIDSTLLATFAGGIKAANLPTSAGTLPAGSIYNDSGTLKVVLPA